MRSSLAFALLAGAFVLGACSDASTGGPKGLSSSGAAASSSAVWTDTKVQQIVETKCATAGCHDGSALPNFVGITESGMKATRQAVIEVRAGTMPKTGSLTPDEKAAFLAFYE